jgi:hypothetical protein
MTQQQQRDFVFNLPKTMIANRSYIKGYGDKFRVMSQDHSPLQNIDRGIMKILELNGVVKRAGLVHVIAIESNPFHAATDVKMPGKI